jgi:hypothetical protein
MEIKLKRENHDCIVACTEEVIVFDRNQKKKELKEPWQK